VQLEAAGRPTVVVATREFETLARAVADRAHLPDARIVVVEHPLGGITDDEVRARSRSVVDDVIACFTHHSS
jgi:hypothetical protein